MKAKKATQIIEVEKEANESLSAKDTEGLPDVIAPDAFDINTDEIAHALSSDSDYFKQALKLLVDRQKVEFLSHLGDEEIQGMTALLIISKFLQEKYGTKSYDLVKSLIDKKLELRVSYERLGRKEFISAFQKEGEFTSQQDALGVFGIRKPMMR